MGVLQTDEIHIRAPSPFNLAEVTGKRDISNEKMFFQSAPHIVNHKEAACLLTALFPNFLPPPPFFIPGAPVTLARLKCR